MADTNLEDVLEQLQFNYGGVLQKLAELHDEVVDQMEMLKTAGTKIRRRNTSYAKDTVLVCVGKNNGSKCLLCIDGGTTSNVTWDESYYNSFQIRQEITDGSVTWECVENLITGSTVEYAESAGHANVADFASSASYADSAGYYGPFHVSEFQKIGVSSPNIAYHVVDESRRDTQGHIYYGGKIIVGNSAYSVTTGSDELGGVLSDGETLYLYGSSSPNFISGGTETECIFSYIALNESAVSSAIDTLTPAEFYTQLAYNSGGRLIQTQFGDITTIPWGIVPEEKQYAGPFKVDAVSSGDSNVIFAKVYDPTRIVSSIDDEGSVIIDSSYAGRVVVGNNVYPVSFTGGNRAIGDGQRIYLYGSSGAIASFDFLAYNDDSQIPESANENEFYTQLAYNSGGKLIQTQFGDINTIPWGISGGSCIDEVLIQGENIKITSGIEVVIQGQTVPAVRIAAPYIGPFNVDIDADGSGLIPIISGSAGEIVGIEGYVNIFDNTNTQISGYGGSAGKIIIGEQQQTIPLKNRLFVSCTGSTAADIYIYSSGLSYDFQAIGMNENPPSVFGNTFYTKLATVGLEGVVQKQFGDIVEPLLGSGGTTIINTSTIINNTSEYNGHFCVSGAIVSEGTPEAAFFATVYDGTNPQGAYAGEIIIGNTVSHAGTSSVPCPIGNRLYLIGTVDGNSVSVEYSAYAGNIEPTIANNQFFTQLAANIGGTMSQMQYGDIVQPVKKKLQELYVNVDGNTEAVISLTGTTETVSFVAGSNMTMEQDADGKVVVAATGGTASPTSFGPPDYSSPIDFINTNTSFPATSSYNYPVWIVGYVEGKTWDVIQYLKLTISSLPPGQIVLQEIVLIDTGHTTEDPSSWYTVPVCIPIPANTEILFHTGSYDTPEDIQLAICPCLTS